MTPEEILSHPARRLSDEQRRFYFEEGYLRLPEPVPAALLTRMQAAVARLVEESRTLTESNDDYVLQDGHTAEVPRMRRVYRATDHDPVFWEFAAQSTLPEVVGDLVGPDVKFREAYVNFKWSKGGDAVEWHQDLPFFPHTNRALLTTLTYLSDVGDDMGPFMVVPQSHKGEMFDHYDADGGWAGRISDTDLPRVAADTAVRFAGPAGTVIIIDSGMIHGSDANQSDRIRPLLVTGYAAADAFAYTAMPAAMTESRARQIVRGRPATHAHHEELRLRMPPDWSQRYTSIFEDQQKEGRSATAM